MPNFFKKIIKNICNKLNWDVVNIRRSFSLYFNQPKEVFFHPVLEKVRKTIYNDCPSSMYRESYHIHQIGSWGALPTVICMFQELKNKTMINGESLDIGCGFGTMAAFCSALGFKASAIDFVPLETYLGEKTMRTYNINFKTISIETEELPWLEKKFDVITMTEVLEHFKYQPLDVLKKINNVLKDDGLFLLTTPALGPHWQAEYYNCPFEDIPSYTKESDNILDRHWKIYDAEELTRLLDKAGFKSLITLNLNINTGNEGFYVIATKK